MYYHYLGEQSPEEAWTRASRDGACPGGFALAYNFLEQYDVAEEVWKQVRRKK